MYRTLVTPQDVNRQLQSPGFRVVDCRFDLANPAAGEAAWRDAHVPGAVYAHLDRDLSSAVTARSGRHPLPDPGKLVDRLGAWGIGGDTQVVAYDAAGGAMAARLWWLLRWLGHDAVAVMDGGWQAWRDCGFAIEMDPPAVAPVRFPRRPAVTNPVSSDDVMSAVEGGVDWRLVDARGAERFRGDVEPIDSVAGHIPGALNRPFGDNLLDNGRFLSPPLLRERFQLVASGRADRVVHYCGSGVTACHNLLAMEHAGLAGSRLYAGSWSEWIRDSAHPVAKGS